MDNVHLAPSDEDDLYSGYNEYHPSLDVMALQEDDAFRQAVRTSYDKRPTVGNPSEIAYEVKQKQPYKFWRQSKDNIVHANPNRTFSWDGQFIHAGGEGATSKVSGTSRVGAGFRGRTAVTSSLGQLPSGSRDAMARPMTAVRGVGYTSSGNRGQLNVFDPMNQARSVISPMQMKDENSPEERLKDLEKKVMELMEESCFAADRKEFKLALDKAKEAAAKERALTRQRDQLAVEASVNMDLTFSVLFNLSMQYEANEMFGEALNTLHLIVKNRSFTNSGRLRVNMGNICFRQGNYAKAIKFYRMALDQVPNTHKDMRIKIMKNIGLVFVKMAQFTDAITSFEYIMTEKPDFRTALHLILCHYALGDKEKMKQSFLKLLSVNLEHADEDEKYVTTSEDPQSNLILEAIKNDTLRKIERSRKHEAEWCMLTASKLISPALASTFSEGYEWCVDQLKSSAYADLANDLEISKAVTYLRKREFTQAIETLKNFEKKETKVASIAATNLSFLYYLQTEISQADEYADQAIVADRYNAGALVNKGNCCFSSGEIEKAQEFYKEALSNDSSCVEALYNLGLTYKKLGSHEESLDLLYKLHAIVRNHPHVVYQIASIYEQLGVFDQAMEWYQQLATLVPTDPHLLSKIGELYDNDGDKQQAFQYHSDSYRYFPSNIEIIEWLGAYYIDSQVFEKAIKYFEKAAIIQPNQVKWQLMVASCHRRSGNYQQALQTYKTIHRRFTENIECLKFLTRICMDLGLKEVSEYAAKLKKAEKAKELKDQRVASSGSRPGSRRSSSRTSRDSSSAGSYTSPVSPSRASLQSITPRSRTGRMTLMETEEPYQPSKKEIDASYEDPLGPQEERPKTAARRRDADDEFDNEELGDDMLPD